ncbi:uncharacterized protein [Nicotiana sylvestris]|uniref:uncharacterized protein n=1 Tax=Nicotiana sylvestris TaxID=4096 RepID=UPI00388C8EE7
MISFVYAKCDDVLREDLWDSLRDIAERYRLPWLIVGDLNYIVDPGEKKGDYSKSIFIWRNGWCPKKRIWKRLDRVLINQEWLNLYFRFLDFWTEEADFSTVVEQAWNMEVQGSPMWKFYMKLKNTCKKLSKWSRNTLANIFDKIEELEHKVEEMETNIIVDNNEVNRASLNQANVLLVRAYKKEESFWKQKSGVKWFVEGEVNSKFFHSVVKGRKKWLTLKR